MLERLRLVRVPLRPPHCGRPALEVESSCAWVRLAEEAASCPNHARFPLAFPLPGWPFNSYGLASLPRQGVAAVSVCDAYGLIAVLNLETGERLCVVEIRYATFLAADDASGLVYVSCMYERDFCVRAFRWDGATLTSQVRSKRGCF